MHNFWLTAPLLIFFVFVLFPSSSSSSFYYFLFFHPGPHWPYIDPTSIPHRPHIDPTSTLHRPCTQRFILHHHISIVFVLRPPPPHFYCFPPPPAPDLYCFPPPPPPHCRCGVDAVVDGKYIYSQSRRTFIDILSLLSFRFTRFSAPPRAWEKTKRGFLFWNINPFSMIWNYANCSRVLRITRAIIIVITITSVT